MSSLANEVQADILESSVRAGDYASSRWRTADQSLWRHPGIDSHENSQVGPQLYVTSSWRRTFAAAKEAAGAGKLLYGRGEGKGLRGPAQLPPWHTALPNSGKRPHRPAAEHGEFPTTQLPGRQSVGCRTLLRTAASASCMWTSTPVIGLGTITESHQSRGPFCRALIKCCCMCLSHSGKLSESLPLLFLDFDVAGWYPKL